MRRRTGPPRPEVMQALPAALGGCQQPLPGSTSAGRAAAAPRLPDSPAPEVDRGRTVRRVRRRTGPRRPEIVRPLPAPCSRADTGLPAAAGRIDRGSTWSGGRSTGILAGHADRPATAVRPRPRLLRRVLPGRARQQRDRRGLPRLSSRDVARRGTTGPGRTRGVRCALRGEQVVSRREFKVHADRGDGFALCDRRYEALPGKQTITCCRCLRHPCFPALQRAAKLREDDRTGGPLRGRGAR